MRRYLKLLLMALVALSLAACSTPNEGELILGMNFDLTGAGAQYGIAELEGAQLAVKLFNENGGFNGEEVKVIYYDGKSDPTESYQAQTTLAEDGAFAIVGATISGTSAQAVKASGEMKVPTVSPSATADSVTNDGSVGYPFGYRVCYSDMFQAVTMANFTVKTKGFTKIGIIADNTSEYAQGLTKVYKETLQDLGGSIVFEEYYAEGESDFSSILTKVKGNNDVEALFIPGYYTEIGPLLRQAHQLDVDLPVFGVDGYDSVDFVDLAGAEALNNVFYSNHYSRLIETEEHTAFVAAFREEYGRDPIGFSALAFDATNLVLDALVRAGEADPIKVNDAIKNTKDFVAVTGVISINDLHNAEKSTYVVELQNGVEVNATIVEP